MKLIIVTNNLNSESNTCDSTNKPIIRKANITAALSEKFIINKIIVDDEIDMDNLVTVHSADYVNFLKN